MHKIHLTHVAQKTGKHSSWSSCTLLLTVSRVGKQQLLTSLLGLTHFSLTAFDNSFCVAVNHLFSQNNKPLRMWHLYCHLTAMKEHPKSIFLQKRHVPKSLAEQLTIPVHERSYCGSVRVAVLLLGMR